MRWCYGCGAALASSTSVQRWKSVQRFNASGRDSCNSECTRDCFCLIQQNPVAKPGGWCRTIGGSLSTGFQPIGCVFWCKVKMWQGSSDQRVLLAVVWCKHLWPSVWSVNVWSSPAPVWLGDNFPSWTLIFSSEMEGQPAHFTMYFFMSSYHGGFASQYALTFATPCPCICSHKLSPY